MNALITTSELAAEIGSPRLRLLDVSWHMPSENRNAGAEFDAAHIPGAEFFDIDAISDRNSRYPHMLPDGQQFARQVAALGIGSDDAVVVYDSNGLFSAARVWWMFRVFGHDRIGVLDGGLPKWQFEGRPLTDRANPVTENATDASFRARYRPELVNSKAQIAANVENPRAIVVDARSPGRFDGFEPEPRPGLKSGHIPGSRNLFFKEVLEPPFNTLKEKEALASLMREKGIDPLQPLVATCGSGVTACILALAFYQLGNPNVAVYDGAWAEWGV